MKTATIVTLVLAGAQFSAARAVAQDLFTAPDVRFTTVQEAQATMRKAGFVGAFEEDHRSLCGSVVDDRIVELGHVCHQVPYPGATFRKAARAQFRVQREDPRHGRVGELLEWHLMPKVVGMTEEEALAVVRDAGFTAMEHISVRYIADFNCQPKRVCSTSPSGHSRAGQNETKSIVIGK